MAIFDKNVEQAIKNLNKEIIKAAEFADGLTLKFMKVEKVKGKFGAAEDSNIVEKGVLEEGEQFLYSFQDTDGITRKHYSTSFPLVIALQQAEINEGDWITITRTGKSTDTRYTAEKTVAPTQQEIDPSKIPF